jgi:hypothetical protein
MQGCHTHQKNYRATADRHRMRPTIGPPTTVPGKRIIEPWLDDALPEYDTEPVILQNKKST